MLKDIVCGVKSQLNNLVLNQENMTEIALAAFFAGGHILLVGPAGLGKTQWAQTLAQTLGMPYKREWLMQGTQPHEVFGGDQHRRIAQVLIAEEIDSANPRVKTILMDTMENQAAAIEGHCTPMPEPFFVIATNNTPCTLPEALNDRFMLSMQVSYPGLAAEKQLLQMYHEGKPSQTPVPVCNPEAIAQAKEEVNAIIAEEEIFNYILSIVETTRRAAAVATGASPRGSIALLLAAKAYAAINGRDFVETKDVQSLALPVLRHRIVLKPEAIKEGILPDHIIESILAKQ
ncbi:MAG: MoxR family ATPase [Defluviitaleaceae bacterium]|nr:MoxR family ATPase [Defluviitaleaceae bacterium]